jgi:hypothetical protein
MTARWSCLVLILAAGCSGPAPEAEAPAPAQVQPAVAAGQETVTPVLPGGGAATPVAGTDSVRGAGGGGVGTTLEGPDDTGADSGE